MPIHVQICVTACNGMLDRSLTYCRAGKFGRSGTPQALQPLGSDVPEDATITKATQQGL